MAEHVHTPACDPAFTLKDARLGAPDPKPWVSTSPDFERYRTEDDYEGRHGVIFLPREGYSQNPEDYK